MKRSKPTRLIIVLLCLFLAGPPLSPPTTAHAAPAEGFAHPAIRDRWTRDDGPVAAGTTQRAWMWGPGPFYTQYEPYTEGPQGNHLVQYFDKGRLEVNNPDADPRSEWFVTSGLLARELVSGKVAVGSGATLDLGPAPIPVAGDTSAIGVPSYASFGATTRRGMDRTGQVIIETLDVVGKRGETAPPIEARAARYEATTGHNWADAFWRFANAPNRHAEFNWLYTLGYPITDPYWIQASLGNKQQIILVQLFERRALTFNPANPPATQVEMGNVGRHYFRWRYANNQEAQLSAEYDATIIVGTAPTRAMSVQLQLALTNSTPRPLNRLVLRTVWKHWEGVFTLKGAEIDGKEAQTKWLNGINLEVKPDTPVPLGKRATLALRFEVKPRSVGGRNGYDRAADILNLGDFLPTLVPWENGDWLYYPYSELGDHGFYASSKYAITVRSGGDESLVVGGTGRIVGVDAGGTEWKFSAQNARDVAYMVSSRFVDPLKDAGMTQTVGNVKMLAYFTPAHRAAGQRQLDLIAPALAWFSEKIGSYPFDTYVVAEMGAPQLRTDNYAQEYPMFYSMPSPWLSLGTSAPSWTWYIPVHEVAHQWFYSLIGSNQLADPWLDEALTTYMTAEYIRDKFPQHYRAAWSSMTGGADRARPVSSGVFSGFTSEQQYTAVVYDGGALMLDRVRGAMGDTRFYAALRDYYRQARFGRATPFLLISILQKHSEADLAPIFSEYLGY